jgi:hypothetical protein
MGSTNDFLKSAPTFEYGNGPNDWLFWDDFNDLNASATAGAAKWLLTESAAGATQLLDTAAGFGILEFTFTATPTDEDVIQFQANSGIKIQDLAPNTPIRFGCRFKTADVSHNDLHLGLSIIDASIAASEPADIAAFRIVAADADGQLDLLIQKDSAEQVTSGIVTLADDTWCRAFFEFWPTVGNTDSGTLYYKVHSGGTLARGTMTISNTFPDDVVIYPTISAQIEGTDADVYSFDWIYCHAIRADYVDGTG